MLKIIPLVVSPIAQNARVLIDAKTGDAVVVDPGGAGADVEAILRVLREAKAHCREIWLTHSHLDHCGGVAELKAATGARLLGHRAEREFREHVEDIARMYGCDEKSFRNCPEPDQYIEDGDTIRCGATQFLVLYTPGHSPGHLSFFDARDGVLLCGDTVFAGSIGRTDLPGADGATLMRSIREKILVLPGTTRLLSGHGEDSTVDQERRSNPFLQEYGWNT